MRGSERQATIEVGRDNLRSGPTARDLHPAARPRPPINPRAPRRHPPSSSPFFSSPDSHEPPAARCLLRLRWAAVRPATSGPLGPSWAARRGIDPSLISTPLLVPSWCRFILRSTFFHRLDCRCCASAGRAAPVVMSVMFAIAAAAAGTATALRCRVPV